MKGRRAFYNVPPLARRLIGTRRYGSLKLSEFEVATLRAMKENTRQGFWNGSRPPFGYRVIAAEKRGDKIKKRLEIDPAEAEIYRACDSARAVHSASRAFTRC